MKHLSLNNVTVHDIAEHPLAVHTEKHRLSHAMPEQVPLVITRFHPQFAMRAQGPLTNLHAVHEAGVTPVDAKAWVMAPASENAVPPKASTLPEVNASRPRHAGKGLFPTYEA